MRQSFPLQWPEGWVRTKYSDRGTPRFESHFTDDRDAVIRRLRRRGANVVITSFLPLNANGWPYIGPVEDPGIAVYWHERRGKEKAATERVIACDRWARAADNMRAIAKSLEALDGLDRWGASQVVERAYAGFAALPPGSSSTIEQPPTRRPWREVLGGTWPADMPAAELLDVAHLRYKRAIKTAHPDAGGDPAIAAELNAAFADAEAELSS